MSLIRSRWAALGAAVAVTLGGGGIGLVSATNPADATTFIAITPCRVMDTRPEPAFNVGPKSSPVGPDEEHAVTAVGNSGDCTAVPANAAAVSLNVTALNATQSTFLTIYASNVTRPDASSLNPTPGDPPTPNAVTTELSPGGQFTVFNRFGNVDVIADINGYYVDHNHDDRYYSKSETVQAAIPRTTVLSYSGFASDNSPSSTLTKLRDIDSFSSSGGPVRLDWTSTAIFSGGASSHCRFQLRIDGLNSNGANGASPDAAVTFASLAPISSVAMFDDLAAGTHDVELWSSGTATTCTDNTGNFNRQVLVTEFGVAPCETLICAVLIPTATS